MAETTVVVKADQDLATAVQAKIQCIQNMLSDLQEKMAVEVESANVAHSNILKDIDASYSPQIVVLKNDIVTLQTELSKIGVK